MSIHPSNHSSIQTYECLHGNTFPYPLWSLILQLSQGRDGVRDCLIPRLPSFYPLSRLLCTQHYFVARHSQDPLSPRQCVQHTQCSTHARGARHLVCAQTSCMWSESGSRRSSMVKGGAIERRENLTSFFHNVSRTCSLHSCAAN